MWILYSIECTFRLGPALTIGCITSTQSTWLSESLILHSAGDKRSEEGNYHEGRIINVCQKFSDSDQAFTIAGLFSGAAATTFPIFSRLDSNTKYPRRPSVQTLDSDSSQQVESMRAFYEGWNMFSQHFLHITIITYPQWSKSVDKSDFVGRPRTSCFCDQNM